MLYYHLVAADGIIPNIDPAAQKKKHKMNTSKFIFSDSIIINMCMLSILINELIITILPGLFQFYSQTFNHWGSYY